MARTRQIKPTFFDNEDLARCSPLARLLWEGMWCWADRNGRLEDRPDRLKARILPYDACDVDALLAELEPRWITRYVAVVDGARVRLIEVRGFTRHQLPHPKEPAIWPGPTARAKVTRDRASRTAATPARAALLDVAECDAGDASVRRAC